MVKLPNQSNRPIRMFYQALINWGVKEDEIQRRLGLDTNQLDQLQTPVSTDQIKHLGEIAQKLTNKPDIGLILGKNATYEKNDNGVIFHIAANCVTVRDSLQQVEKYSCLVQNLISFHLREEDDIGEICYDFLNIDIMSLPIIEYSLVGLIAVLKYVIGDEFKPMRINFRYPPPQYVDKYQDAFDTQLKFNQDLTSIVLHRKYLDTPNPNPVSLVKEVLSEHVDIHLKKVEKDALFQEKIHKLIVERLQGGKVRIESIAKEFKLSRWMLHQKLKEENTSFKSILAATRKKLAKQYLKDPSLNIDQISSLLGYTESSSFKRAFKRWFGVYPGQYRKQAKQAD